jgi:hypothetical protein
MSEGALPSDDERRNVIRAHADQAMRYYATAFMRENGENRELLRVYMSITANFIALVEGDRLDDRAMNGTRDNLIEDYLEQAKSDPWEPGTCSFCGGHPVAAWFEGPNFRTFVRRSTNVRSEEAWLACAACVLLVEADDREALVARGVRRAKDSRNGSAEAIIRQQQQERFWKRRAPLA